VTEAYDTPSEEAPEDAPADLLVARQADVTRDMLREGIRQLQPIERDALRLATREYLPVSQIAEQLEISSDDVETALREGLLRLRASLMQHLDGSPG
jgi:DNA-directed RNA polymerase specialized sigma24 family protein